MAETTDDQTVAADAVGVEAQIDARAQAPGAGGVRPMLTAGHEQTSPTAAGT